MIIENVIPTPKCILYHVSYKKQDTLQGSRQSNGVVFSVQRVRESESRTDLLHDLFPSAQRHGMSESSVKDRCKLAIRPNRVVE